MAIREIRRRLNTHICSDLLLGIKDGINREFVLKYVPIYPETVQLFLNGLLMTLRGDKDFILPFQSVKIIFNINQIPQPNDILVAFYITK